MSVISGPLFEIACAPNGPVEDQRSPLGFLRSGRPVWPIVGAEPDDDDEDDDDDDDSSDEDDDDDDDTDSGGAGKKKKKKVKDGDADDDDEDDDESVSAEDAARLKRRMKRADQRATKAENELRELKRKGTPEQEQQSADLKEAQSKVEKLTESNKHLTMQNAFLLSNTFTWHDPADVMEQVLKDDDIEIDDEGHVSGMDAVLKRIAKKKPYLLKQTAKDKDDDEDDDDDEDEDTRPASGGAQNRRKKKGGVDRAKILATYPALNRR